MARVKSRVHVALVIVCTFALGGPISVLAQTPSAPAPSEATATTSIAGHGVQLANLDRSVDPGQDFYRYATDGWQDRNEIPPDEAYWGAFDQVADLTRVQLIALLNRYAASGKLPVGSDEWKAVQLFAQAKDVATRNAQGITPIAGDLERIEAIDSLDALYAFLRDAPLTSNVGCGLSCIQVLPDYANSSVYAAWYSSPYLGLPSRDYYWEDDEVNEPIREAYRAMSAKLLGFAGYEAERATAAAANVYAFEKRLAEPMFRLEEWNDPKNYYHPRPVADVAAADPEFDWPTLLATMGIPDVKTIVFTEEA